MFKYIYNPLGVFIFVILMFISVRLIGGVEYPEVSYYCAAIYFVSILLFIMGYLSAPILYKNSVSTNAGYINIYKSYSNFALKLIILVSLLALLISFADVYTMRDYFTQGVTEARYQRGSEGIAGKPLGILADAFIGVPVVAMAVVLLRRELIKEKWIVVVTVLFFIGSLLVSISTGGRNGLFLSLLFVLCTFLVRKRKKLKAIPRLPYRMKYIGILMFVMVLVFSVTIFVDREEFRNRQPEDTIQNLVEIYDVSGWMIDTSDPGVFTQLYVMMNIYFTHSLNEFDYLITNESDVGPFFGAANFYQPVIVLNKIGFNLYTLEEIIDSRYRSGVYIGFLGMLYLDFGVMGIVLIMFAFGFFTKSLWINIRRNNSIMKELMLVYFLVQIITFPFYSIVSIANGLAILIGIILFYFVNKLKRVKIILGAKASDKLI